MKDELVKLSMHYKNGDFDNVIRLIERNSSLLQDIRIANLLAVAYRKKGMLHKSKLCFKSILSQSQHPGVFVSYSLLLSDLKQYKEAVFFINKAISIDGEYFDAHYNLGIIAGRKSDYKTALSAYQKAMDLNPEHSGAFYGVLTTLVSLEKLNSALNLLTSSIFYKNYEYSARLLAAKIMLKQFKFDEALTELLILRKRFPSSVDVKFYQIVLMLKTGGLKEGIRELVKLHEDNLCNVDVNNLLFEYLLSINSSNPFEYYEKACEQSLDKYLVLDYLNKLIKMTLFVNAFKLVNKAVVEYPSERYFLIIKAILFRETGLINESRNLLCSIISDATIHQNVLYESAINSLCEKKFAQAYKKTVEGMSIEPGSHKWKTLNYVCEKYLPNIEPLDLGGVISVVDNALPDDLLCELKVYLFKLHESKKIHIMQSIRHGNQTEGNLFHFINPIIDNVKKLLTTRIVEYCKQRGLQFEGIVTGAWSIYMFENGYHVNHTHSEGTYSACLYLSIPADCNKNGNGWFKCGGANVSNKFIDDDDLFIQPIANRMIIFPSYIPHGTNTLTGSEPRLTLAFDYKIIA